MAAVAGGTLGVLLSIWLQTVIGALTVFYSLLVVTLLVPIVGGLYSSRATEREALAAIVAGVLTLFALRIGSSGSMARIDPALGGIVAGAAVFVTAMAARGRGRRVRL